MRRQLHAGGLVPRVCVGVSWDDGGLECDLVAFVLGEDARVLSDEGFVFYNNPGTPGASVLLRQPSHPAAGARHRAQVFLDLRDAGPMVARVRLALATVQPGTNLTAVRNLRWEVLDVATGELLAAESVASIVHTAAVVLGDVCRDPQGWSVEVLAESRTDGLSGLARSLGVDLQD